MKKIINITHNDLDGVGCSILTKLVEIDSNEKITSEVHHCNYSTVEDCVANVLDRMDDGDDIHKVIITDISFREKSKLPSRINKSYSSRVVVLDHHATSNYLNRFKWGLSKEKNENGEKTCGTMWYYRYLVENGFEFKNDKFVSKFVKLVNLWDTWRWVEDYDTPYEDASLLNMLLFIKGKELFTEDILNQYLYCSEFGNCLEFEFSYEDNILLRYKKQEIDRVVHNKEKEMVVGKFLYNNYGRTHREFIEKYLEDIEDGDKYERLLSSGYRKKFDVGVVYLNDNISDVGNELSKRHPELDFIIIVSMPNTLSFRTTNDLPVPLGIIANFAGSGKGGGHPQSAGAIVSGIKKQSMLNTIIPEFDGLVWKT